MGLFDFFKQKKAILKKSVRPFMLFGATRSNFQSANDADYFAQQGYAGNVVAYRCIKEIVDAASSIDIDIYKDDKLIDKKLDPFVRLIKNPSPYCNFTKLIKRALTDYLISGNAFILGYAAVNNQEDTTPPTALPVWFELIPPQYVTVEASALDIDIPAKYRVEKLKNGSKEYSIDAINGVSRVFHFKSINPLSNLIGLSPLHPANLSMLSHTKGTQWNLSLLENSARPSGILSTDEPLSDDEFARLKEEKESAWAGAKNAGSFLFFDKSLNWQEMGLSPKDMDFIEGIDLSARNIASAYGVPFQLITPEASTYNNMREARMALYENTVIPLIEEFLSEFSQWISKITKQNYEVKPNLDQVDALEDKRKIKTDRFGAMVKSGLITINEARIELGFDEVSDFNANQLLVPTTYQPLDQIGFIEAVKSLNTLDSKGAEG